MTQLGEPQETREYLKEKSADIDSPGRLFALSARGYAGDADAFKEAWQAYQRKEISLDRLRSISGTLLAFDNGLRYPHIDVLAQALKLMDPTITRNVAYALRHSGADEAVPLLVSVLDASDLMAQHHAVLGLWELEKDDKKFPITGQDYAPGTELFEAAPESYVNRWKAWWNSYGHQKYESLSTGD